MSRDGAVVLPRNQRYVLIALAVATTTLTVQQPALAQNDDRIASLAWLAGAWVSQNEGGRLEESWTAPAGNSMVGIFRWIRGERLWMAELMYITDEEGELTFRLRHFSAEMTPWEARDDPFVYRLEERSAGRAAFSAVQQRAERPLRFVFEALPGDSLLVRLEAEREGRATVQEFRFGRAK